MTTIFLDFDNTMVQSDKKIVEILNKKYSLNKSESDIEDYGYKSIYSLMTQEEIQNIYEMDDFFDGLEFKDKALETCIKYKDKYNFIISTKGTPVNLTKKKIWIEKNFPIVFEFQGMPNTNFDKSDIDMSNSIQIDDNVHCLNTNASLKILYKNFNNYEWQKTEPNNTILVSNDWDEIDKILDFYSKYDIETLARKE